MWRRHFQRMAEGKIRPNRKGHWVVETIQDGGASREPDIKFVTPVAQDIQLAKSELKEDKSQRVKRKRKVNKKASSVGIHLTSKRARTANDVFSKK